MISDMRVHVPQLRTIFSQLPEQGTYNYYIYGSTANIHQVLAFELCINLKNKATFKLEIKHI